MSLTSEVRNEMHMGQLTSRASGRRERTRTTSRGESGVEVAQALEENDGRDKHAEAVRGE